MVADYFRSSPHWLTIEAIRHQTLAAFDAPNCSPATIAVASAKAILEALGWNGSIVWASDYRARDERTLRLVDLTCAIGARTYVCGTGGMTYLNADAFAPLDVVPFALEERDGPWTARSRKVSALWPLARFGPRAVAEGIAHCASRQGLHAPLCI